MRNLVNGQNVQRVDATVKITSLPLEERRMLAKTAADECELEVLAELDGDVTKRMLLENSYITSRVLEKIAKCVGPACYEDEFAEAAASHPKADGNLLRKLAQNASVSVRHIVAMRGDVPQDVLKKLAEDGQLSVRALATRRLGLPPKQSRSRPSILLSFFKA